VLIDAGGDVNHQKNVSSLKLEVVAVAVAVAHVSSISLTPASISIPDTSAVIRSDDYYISCVPAHHIFPIRMDTLPCIMLPRNVT
jgi:hypothetical protein